ncbi:MAG: RNA polymerase subunit sigma [Proteobacteria bacterium SG_bin9]|nr:MAG: RNA polymerase subunit sigma [Proteobacteria bacterium SG_bin9]
MSQQLRVPATDYERMEETGLVGLAQRGDCEAFRAIMQRCNQRLFRIARGIVRDDPEAEDVLQEVYTRAFAAIGSFRQEASLITWLTRITINEARGRLRRQRNLVDLAQVEAEQNAGADVFMFPSGQSVDSPEAEAGRAQVRRILEQAVDTLPEPFRLVFIMRDVQECSIEETADVLGLRPETVKTRLHRARRLLRQALDEKLASTMTEAFPFLGRRCERITGMVLARLARVHGWE